MMDHKQKNNHKVQIYKGIILYLLDSTHYTLKNIASLTNTSIKALRSIYLYEEIPHYFKSELQLVRLFQIILEINSHSISFYSYFLAEKNNETD